MLFTEQYLGFLCWPCVISLATEILTISTQISIICLIMSTFLTKKNNYNLLIGQDFLVNSRLKKGHNCAKHLLILPKIELGLCSINLNICTKNHLNMWTLQWINIQKPSFLANLKKEKELYLCQELVVCIQPVLHNVTCALKLYKSVDSFRSYHPETMLTNRPTNKLTPINQLPPPPPTPSPSQTNTVNIKN